jgi:hypothetical protein
MVGSAIRWIDDASGDRVAGQLILSLPEPLGTPLVEAEGAPRKGGYLTQFNNQSAVLTSF